MAVCRRIQRLRKMKGIRMGWTGVLGNGRYKELVFFIKGTGLVGQFPKTEEGIWESRW